jgi:predicted nuclease of predicted toxin-antitoxin system
VPLLREEFPDSAHVAELDLAQSTDRQIWNYAGQNDYVIVSKDSDFRQLASSSDHRQRPSGSTLAT